MPNKGVSVPVMERIRSRLVVDDATGCLVYTGCRNAKGYGVVHGHHKTTLVHRIVYMETVAPVGDGLQVCHRCDNPPCCNPAHLFVGTLQDNWADMMAKGRGRWLKHDENPRARLTAKQVLEIQLLRGEESGPKVAARFGVDRSVVTKIWRGVSWKGTAMPAPRKQKSSQHTGVSFRDGKWEVGIPVNGKRKWVGCFDTELAAAIAYNIEAVKLRGDKARLNDVFSGNV